MQRFNLRLKRQLQASDPSAFHSGPNESPAIQRVTAMEGALQLRALDDEERVVQDTTDGEP